MINEEILVGNTGTEFKSIQVVLPNDEQHHFDSGLLTDPATGIEISVERVFEDLI